MVFAVVFGVVVVVDEEEDGDGEFAAEGRRFVSSGSCRKQLLERFGCIDGCPSTTPILSPFYASSQPAYSSVQVGSALAS